MQEEIIRISSCIFFFNLDQDDIGTDLADTFPGNDVFGIAAENSRSLPDREQ